MNKILNNICSRTSFLKRETNKKILGKFPHLWLMTDHNRLPNPLAIVEKLPMGSGVILRDYKHPERYKLAVELSDLCKNKKICLLVGADPNLALSINADGMHLPTFYNYKFRANKFPKNWIVTASAHCKASLNNASNKGAKVAFLSPVFQTKSHPNANFLGQIKLAELTNYSDIPVVALGGINSSNVALLRESGIIGIAAISGLMQE